MNGSQLASVNDVFNAILVRGNATGDVVFYGKGAGKLPTASAVVADVIDCARNADKRKPFGWGDTVENYVVDFDTDANPLYVRAKTEHKETAKTVIENAIGEIKLLTFDGAPDDEIAFVTKCDEERKLVCALDNISEIKIESLIRITDY